MFLLLFAGLLFVVFYRHYQKGRKFEHLPKPGISLPFIGNYQIFLEGGKDPVTSLYRKYSRNGMILINMLGQNMLFVGDFEKLKYLFNLPEAQNRGHSNWKVCGLVRKMNADRMIKDGPIPGVITSQGKIWSEQRRFTLKTLRDFGFGKASMEELILEEVRHFNNHLEEIGGKGQVSIDIAGKLNLPILNALWRITVGEKLEYDDPTLLDIVNRLSDLLQRLGNPATLLAITQPWIFKIFPKLLQRHEEKKLHKDIARMLEEKIDEHLNTIDYNEPRDFIDKVLIEIKNTTETDSSFHGKFGIENLTCTLADLFIAGSETTSTTLTWACLYMAREPEIQQRVHKEIDEVIGIDRLPKVADKESMPYVEAVITEIQRCGNIIPLGVQHSSGQDIMVDGTKIPANTLISPLLTEVMKGSYWKDGYTFNPARFIDESGQFRKSERVIPFSIGRRICLGETLAKAELFLFFTGLMQRFTVLPEVDGVKPSEDYQLGETIMPLPFKIKLQPRY